MIRRIGITRAAKTMLAEILMLGLVAVALGRDVSQAAGSCSSQLDCHQSCTNYEIGKSRQTIEAVQRFVTGTSQLPCGREYTYNQSDCQGTGSDAQVSCPNNCCS
jgi:hypothetical protein